MIQPLTNVRTDANRSSLPSSVREAESSTYTTCKHSLPPESLMHGKKTDLRSIRNQMPQNIQMCHIMRFGKVGHKVALFLPDDELLIVGKNVICKVNKEYQLFNNWEVLHQVGFLRKDGLGPHQGDQDLSSAHLRAQEHGHQPRSGWEVKSRFLHLMLDYAAIDVVEQRLDDSRVTVGPVVARQIT